MRRFILLLLVAIPAFCERRSEVRDQGRPHRSSYCFSCVRDENGRIKRDPAMRRAFRAETPCPATGRNTGACPGFVVDHIVALKHGGLDVLANMQWQPIADARAKDRVE